MTDLIEQVARVLCEAADNGPDDCWSKGPAWTYYKPEARQAIAIIVERCALECDEFLMTKTSLDVLDIVTLKARICTLAGGENNGGV